MEVAGDWTLLKPAHVESCAHSRQTAPMRLPLIVLVLTGCGSLKTRIDAPVGLQCDRLIIPSGSLEAQLGEAVGGDCVVLPSGTYEGSFVLPKDVSLTAAEGASVTLKGTSSAPVLRIEGGPRSIVRGLKIIAGQGFGIAIDPGPASLVAVTVSQSSRGGLSSTCTRSDCDQREVVLEDCELSANAVGLVAVGSVLKMEHGRIADSKGAALSSGSGIVGTAGASLTLRGVTIENNENVGVLIDGAATRATVDGCTVKDNRSRGIWIQGPVGAGAVLVTGGELSGNGLVGIGARDTSGLTIRNSNVTSTVLVKVPVDISTFEDIGDGIGLFSGTRSTTLEAVVSKGNSRAQVLADQCGAGVKIGGELSGGQFRIVVQRTANPVDVPAQSVDLPGRELAVKSDPIELMP
jgi:nitrous oxidase accessory protein NosD